MILKQIIHHKLSEVAVRRKRLPFLKLKDLVKRLGPKKRVFLKALRKKVKPIAVIAEIKRKSPSKGIIRRDFNAIRIARAYQKNGAAALSVLTDKRFFGGSDKILTRVKQSVGIPLLRKDFILTEYQIWESRFIGADAILLIAACLPKSKLKTFSQLAESLGLDVLFEVHTKEELKKLLPLKPRLIGINNRNLKNFTVNLETTAKLSPLVPGHAFLVSESGIFCSEDVHFVQKYRAKGILVGESLMKAANPGQALRSLLKGLK